MSLCHTTSLHLSTHCLRIWFIIYIYFIIVYDVYTNAQGRLIIELRNPEFIIFLETHLTNDVKELEYQLLKYNHYVRFSNSTRTGSVILYIKKDWNVEKLPEKVANSKY